jgi:hypothetical protein
MTHYDSEKSDHSSVQVIKKFTYMYFLFASVTFPFIAVCELLRLNEGLQSTRHCNYHDD